MLINSDWHSTVPITVIEQHNIVYLCAVNMIDKTELEVIVFKENMLHTCTYDIFIIYYILKDSVVFNKKEYICFINYIQNRFRFNHRLCFY